jgi:hypothetical protein
LLKITRKEKNQSIQGNHHQAKQANNLFQEVPRKREMVVENVEMFPHQM